MFNILVIVRGYCGMAWHLLSQLHLLAETCMTRERKPERPSCGLHAYLMYINFYFNIYKYPSPYFSTFDR